MNISKWPIFWLKVMVVILGFMLLIQFISLITTADKGERLSSFIFFLIGALVFGYFLLGLKIGFDREEKR